MDAIKTLYNIVTCKNLALADLRYCLVDDRKHPFTVHNCLAKPNRIEDFCSLNDICNCTNIESYAGIGISIQASNISAIDIDHCFSKPFDASSGDARAKEAIETFKDDAYIEFSFSGLGLRILFRTNIIEDYQELFYIKNDKNGIEYYQPSNSFRYVTITGMTICDNSLEAQDITFFNKLYKYLLKNMSKPRRTLVKSDKHLNETVNINTLQNKVKSLYFRNYDFQELWFGQAPGSNSDESQKDFRIVQYLYDNITTDKEKIRLLFESSPYYKSKDGKHIRKWEYQNYRYLDYMYKHLT